MQNCSFTECNGPKLKLQYQTFMHIQLSLNTTWPVNHKDLIRDIELKHIDPLNGLSLIRLENELGESPKT